MPASLLRRARRRVTRPLVRAVAASLFGPFRLWMSLVFATSRVDVRGDDACFEQVEAAGGGVMCFYHEYMLLASWVVRRRKIVAVTTRVDAGTLLAGVMRGLGFAVVRSRKRRDSLGTVDDVVKALRDRPGYVAGLAVDGPSGPRREVKAGAAITARRADCPAYTLRFEVKRCLRWPSWDRCVLPLPLGRIRVRFDPVADPPGRGAAGLRRAIQASLDRPLATESDAAAENRTADQPGAAAVGRDAGGASSSSAASSAAAASGSSRR